ncbi:MAG TPA: carbon storage regulator CsrA [Pseudogracilibacillus sp.]|nr:carbon storage regulator CsrA [Pseudogracilibacillus sp.]
MLILKRNVKETICIGNDIEVSVLAVEGDQVKIGVAAPKNVDIHRKEIFDAIQAENNLAAEQKVDLTKIFPK